MHTEQEEIEGRENRVAFPHVGKVNPSRDKKKKGGGGR